VKFILIISKEKSKPVAGKDSGVSDRMSDLQLWMCIAWNFRFLVIFFYWFLETIYCCKKRPKHLVLLKWCNIFNFECALLKGVVNRSKKKLDFQRQFISCRDKLGISDRGTPYQTFMILDSVVYTLTTVVIQAVDEDSR
jgi:hypothetical protein